MSSVEGVFQKAKKWLMEELNWRKEHNTWRIYRDACIADYGKFQPFQRAGMISRLYFTWVFGLLWYAFFNDMDVNDLWHVNDAESADRNGGGLVRWYRIHSKVSVRLALYRSIVSEFGRRLAMGACVFAGWCVFYVIGGGILMPALITWFTNDEPFFIGIILSLLLTLSYYCQILLVHHGFFASTRTGVRMRSAITMLVYDKCMNLFNVSGDMAGLVMNICSSDVYRVFEGAQYFHFLWISPVLILIYSVVTVFWIGYAGIPCVVFTLCLIPIQLWLAFRISDARRNTTVISDERITLFREVMLAIRLVKYYAWERYFSDRLAEIRSREVEQLRVSQVVKSLNRIVGFSVVSLAVVVGAAFKVFVLKEDLQISFIFNALLLLSQVRFPVTMMSWSAKGMVEAHVAINRVSNFLASAELHRYVQGMEAVPEDVKEANAAHGEMDVLISDASLSYDREGKDILSSINFVAPKGKLVAVVGAVGSGKSSLLGAVLGELLLTKGDVYVSGSKAYAAQNPWIFNGTLRSNITMGAELDMEYYTHVVNSCQLSTDIEKIGDKGDQTKIGEKGTNMSGGQKARVSLARAAYARKDIVLLDDPLSALDQHVGHDVFHKCIRGTLAESTVILVTHQLQYLKHCDLVYYMDEGRIVASGKYDDLLSVPAFLEFVSTVQQDASEQPVSNHRSEKGSESTDTEMETPLEADAVSLRKLRSLLQLGPEFLNERELERKKPKVYTMEELNEMGDVAGKRAEEARKGRGTAQMAGLRPWLTYAYWGRPFSYLGGFVLIALFVLTQVLQVVRDLFLGFWGNDTLDLSDEVYFYIVIAMVIVFTVTILCRDLLYAIWCLGASTTGHNRGLVHILAAKMSWFDRTPVGDILNRFAKDLDFLDDQLPDFSNQLIFFAMIVISSLLTMAVAVPILLIPLIVLVVVFLLLLLFFRQASTKVKSLMATTQSPIYEHISSSISGISSIRGFGIQDRFLTTAVRDLDLSSRSFFALFSAQRFVGLYMDHLSWVAISLMSVFGVWFGRDDPVLVSLAIVYSAQMPGLFQWTVRLAVETEGYMVSVGRLEKMSRLEKEGIMTQGRMPPENWPSKGDIEFKEVCLAYESLEEGGEVLSEVQLLKEIVKPPAFLGGKANLEGVNLALDHISCTMKAGERIGIIGRSGSGKSTLTSSLFRLVEPLSGTITIDGVDICRLDLQALRSSLFIIPQDPVLFQGNVRYNLDPFCQYTDEQIWKALHRVALAERISALPMGLDSEVKHGGDNFSHGERQILCICRAVLRNSKILISDEATSSIDIETDEKIQKTIRKVFSNSTVLTVAHRLNTIIDSDRVMVMDAGKLIEFDTPAVLLKNPESLFSKLVDKMGPVAAARLRAIAYGEETLYDNLDLSASGVVRRSDGGHLHYSEEGDEEEESPYKYKQLKTHYGPFGRDPKKEVGISGHDSLFPRVLEYHL